MNRKSPIKHSVKSHTRNNNRVKSYVRGSGRKTANIADPVFKNTLKHYIVHYETFFNDELGARWVKDSTNCFVRNKKDIIADLQSSFIGKAPPIRIISAELHAPAKPRLKPLLDADSRTQSRLNRGYILDEVQISLIHLPSVRSRGRYEDNYKQMKATKAVPPVYLTPRSDGTYDVEDGVHRINVAKDLGYESIPALVDFRE